MSNYSHSDASTAQSKNAIGRLPHVRRALSVLHHDAARLWNQVKRAISTGHCCQKLATAGCQVQRREENLREDLMASVASLGDLVKLNSKESRTRKKTFTQIEYMSKHLETLDVLRERLRSMMDVITKMLSRQAIVRAVLSTGTVLEAILVYVPRKHHFTSLLALSQPGGAQPDVASVRMKQVEPPPSIRDPTMNIRMREIVVDWLLEVHCRYNLSNDVLFHSVALMDRLLLTTLGERDNARTAAVASLAAAFLCSRYCSDVAPRCMQANVPLLSDANRKQQKRQARQNTLPPHPPHPPHPPGGKQQRRTGILSQPGGRQRGRHRQAQRR